jgi:hypothetical protein
METSGRWGSSVTLPTLIGTALQLLMVVAGHFSPAVAHTLPHSAWQSRVSLVCSPGEAAQPLPGPLQRVEARLRVVSPRSLASWCPISWVTCRPQSLDSAPRHRRSRERSAG